MFRYPIPVSPPLPISRPWWHESIVIHGLTIDRRQEIVAQVGCIQHQDKGLGLSLIQSEIAVHPVVPDILVIGLAPSFGKTPYDPVSGS